MRKQIISFFILLLFLLNSCGENPFATDPEEEVLERGDIVAITSESEISLEELKSMFSENFGSEGIQINLRCGIKIYSAIYRTIDYNGNSTDASGLLVVPLKDGPYPLVSLHHGTQTKRENVGSQDALISFDALLAGALGYVALSPDMLGLGVSTLVHPYHVADVNANTVIDFIRAVRRYSVSNNIQLNQQLFLAGYSQGGYTTMAVHKKIQEELSSEFNVTASVAMAGAYDLLGTAQSIVENDEYDRPSYLAFITYAYSQVYGWNDLSQFFKHPYENLIPTLYDGSLTTDEIEGAFPGKLSDLFQETFLLGIKNGSEEVVTNTLKENSLLNWGPKAPVLIVHGDADTFVPYQNALTAKENWEANGAVSVELITIKGGTHYTSLLPAILNAVAWLENFKADGMRLAGNY